jgi:hypothetical protein
MQHKNLNGTNPKNINIPRFFDFTAPFYVSAVLEARYGYSIIQRFEAAPLRVYPYGAALRRIPTDGGARFVLEPPLFPYMEPFFPYMEPKLACRPEQQNFSAPPPKPCMEKTRVWEMLTR